MAGAAAPASGTAGLNMYKLYGAEFSLYSGKARAYLRKKNIPFEEINSSLKVYRNFIIPRTGVKYIPVVQTPDDQVYQDTTVIIDALEQQFPDYPVYPETPAQRLVSLLLELYGDEWLLIYAMHYRWNYPDTNYRFIIGEFGRMLLPGWPGPVQRWMGKKVGSRFAGFVPLLGISKDNQAAVEQSYTRLLADLNNHFQQHDYLLGSCPCIGDFGFIGPFYAHLYRDPYPGEMMRKTAPAVVAWVERMVSNEPAEGSFLDDDAIPESLLPVLNHMAAEQLPVLQDTAERLSAWRNDDTSRQQPDSTVPRQIGRHQFSMEGVIGERMVLPYGLWMWQRSLDYYQSLTGEDRQAANHILSKTGFDASLEHPLPFRLERHNNRLYCQD